MVQFIARHASGRGVSIDSTSLEQYRSRYEASAWLQRARVLQSAAYCALSFGIILLGAAVSPRAMGCYTRQRRFGLLSLSGGICIALFQKLKFRGGLESPKAVCAQSRRIWTEFQRDPLQFPQLKRIWGETEGWRCLSWHTIINPGELREESLEEYLCRYRNCPELLTHFLRGELEHLGLLRFAAKYRHCEDLSPHMPLEEFEKAQLQLGSTDQIQEMFRAMKEYGAGPCFFFPLIQEQVLDRYAYQQLTRFRAVPRSASAQAHGDALVALMSSLGVLFEFAEGREFLFGAESASDPIAGALIDSLAENPYLLIDAHFTSQSLTHWIDWLRWDRLFTFNALQKIPPEIFYVAFSPLFCPRDEPVERCALQHFQSAAKTALGSFIDDFGDSLGSFRETSENAEFVEQIQETLNALGNWPAALGISVDDVHIPQVPSPSSSP